MMNTKTNGFTLIEMMTVVAVIAILASLAIPSMLDAQIRASIKSSLEVAEIARTHSTKKLLDNECPDDYIQGVGGKYLDKIVREHDVLWHRCKVAMVMKDVSSVPEKIRGKRVEWILNMDSENKVWTCETTLPEGYRPSGCSFSG